MGGTGIGGGRISVGEKLVSVSLGGSLIAGPGQSTGAIAAGGNIGPVVIKLNVDARDFSSGSTAGVNSAGSISSITVGGFAFDADFRALKQMGVVKIGGDVVGTRISGVGQENVTATDLAIKAVTVGGTVRGSNIYGGFTPTSPSPWVNADAQIGAVAVGGAWIASSISAGIDPVNEFHGDGDDDLAPSDDPTIVARIASIRIGSQVIGTPIAVSNTDAFGFAAQHIGSLKIGGVAFPLDSGPENDWYLLSIITNDLRLREFSL